MKVNRVNGRKVVNMTLVFVFGFFLIAMMGCGSADTTTSSDIDTQDDTKSESFEVAVGARMQRTATPTGKMTFKITNVDPDFTGEPNPIFYLYDPKTGYMGGRLTDGLSVDVMTHKMKVYDAYGNYKGEPRFGITWNMNTVYDVTVEWSNGVITATIAGSTVSSECVMPASFNIGIGYPPQIRAGLIGAKYTDIQWPTDSKVVQ